MAFVEVLSIESYRMASSAEYAGDYVESRVLRIGDKRFESSRIRWADGAVTVYITPYNSTERLHEWQTKIVSRYGADTLGLTG